MTESWAEKKARIQAQFPQLYYRNGTFNAEAYRALKPEFEDWRPTVQSLYDTLRPGFFGKPKVSDEPDSMSKPLRKLAKQQQAVHYNALEDTKEDIRQLKRRAEYHRFKGKEVVSDMHEALNQRDRSPTRK